MAKDTEKPRIFGVKSDPQAEDPDRVPVVNLKGTSDRTCSCCDSWIDHWKNNARSTRNLCVYIGCNKKTRHGAHIKEFNVQAWKRVGKIWIVPLCPSHNHPSRENPFYIKNSWMVSEDKTKYCRRSPPPAVNKNNNYYVKIISMITSVACPCGTPIQHYKISAKSRRTTCAFVNCSGEARNVASVKWEDDRTDAQVRWLIPVCDNHARKNFKDYIVRSAAMAPRGEQKSCRPA